MVPSLGHPWHRVYWRVALAALLALAAWLWPLLTFPRMFALLVALVLVDGAAELFATARDARRSRTGAAR